MQAPQGHRRVHPALLVFGIVLVALNLRTAIAGFPPLLPAMQQELHADSGTLSLLTTIPMLAFGLLAPLAPWLTRRISIELVVLSSMAVAAVGSALRAGPTLGWILLGTVLLGASIALLNVLLPGLIKREYPTRTGLMTGVFTLALAGGAALASGLAMPLADAFGGWRPSLAAWAALTVVGVVAWLPTLRSGKHHEAAASPPAIALGRDPVAWQVTAFMALQSLIFFTWLTWLPKLFTDHGMSAAESGYLLAVANLVQLPVALGLPTLAGKLRDQRALAAGTSAVLLVALVGLLAWPMAAPLLWVSLLGVGGGASIAIALAFLVLRARDPHHVPPLSAMAQGYGYLIAAAGPFAFGWLHDVSHGWTLPMVFLVVCAGAMLVSGLAAGRNVFVGGAAPAPTGPDEAAWASVGASREAIES